MWNSEDYYEKLLDGWERSETSDGIPYYLNHTTERTQWDHPLLFKTMEELVDMDVIRYAAYRTAMKLRFIQKRLRLDFVDLPTVEGVFERHGFPASQDTIVDASGLYNILVDIFLLIRNTESTRNKNKEQSAELLLNWILNLYDVNRTGSIRVLSVKISLAALCCARLVEKRKYIFKQLRDHTNHISRKKMTVFLHTMAQLPEQIKESSAFGGLNIKPAVESCFQQAWNSAGVTEVVYNAWLSMEPQTLVWWSTFHRMAAAETVKHESKCNICKMYPIIGFRYKCLKCFNFDMCQQCFFTGRTKGKHKLRHPVQEYCVATTSKEDTRAFLETIKNNLSKKHRNKIKLRYLPIHGTDRPPEDVLVDDLGSPDAHSSMHRIADRLAEVEETSPASAASSGKSSSLKKSANSSPQHPSPGQLSNEDNMFEKSGIYLAGPDRREMDNIVLQLERENKELLHEIENLRHMWLERVESGSDSSEKEWLQDERERLEVRQDILETHNRQLEYQLQRLRHLIGQGSYVETRSPLLPVTTNIPQSSTVAKPPRNDDKKTAADTRAQIPQDYTPRHPQAPPAYMPSDDVADNAANQNQSFFSDSLLMPVPQQNAHKQRRFISPIRPLSQGSDDERADPNIRKSLNMTEGLSQLEVDITLGSTDPTLAQTHFTLPDAVHSVDYDDEEAEMDELLERLGQAFPADASHSSAYLDNKSTMDRMFKAAHGIGDVMAELASPGANYISADISAVFAGGSTEEVDLTDPPRNEREDTVDFITLEGAVGHTSA